MTLLTTNRQYSTQEAGSGLWSGALLFGCSKSFHVVQVLHVVVRAQPDRVSNLIENMGSVGTRVSSPRPVLPAS